MQRIESFEGERYFFDIILQSNKGKTTFEVRSTCADTGATAVVTAVKELAARLLENTKKKNDPRYKESVWEVSEIEGKELFEHAVALFNHEEIFAEMEDAMNDDRASGKWKEEDEFVEEFGIDDDADADFDDDEFDGEFSEDEFR